MSVPQSEIDIALPAKPECAPLLRGALNSYLRALGLPNASAFDVLVAAGEATGNVIEHAYRDRPGSVRLRAYVERRRLVIEISDRGRWRTDGDATRGRGLGLMRALVDRVSIESSQRGTSVRLEVALNGASAVAR